MKTILSIRNMEGVTLHFSNRSGGFVIFDCVFRNENQERKIYTAKVHRFKGENPLHTMERHYKAMREWWNKTFDLSKNMNDEKEDGSVRFVIIALVESRDYGYNVKRANHMANVLERNRISFNRINYGVDAVINTHVGGNGRPPKKL
jgi:hypothetical protein